ncbi:Fic family protein [Pilimelia terevasa]|nr:Fic family protein [Pilimelia terevasa]
MSKVLSDKEFGPRVIGFISRGVASAPYLPWDELRYKNPPDGLTPEAWWWATKIARIGMSRKLSLTDISDRPFTFALPDEVLREIDFVATNASGQIRQAEEVTNPSTRDRYLVSQLIEEAITSSQLEGASTSRKVAREMIRSGRDPRDRSERMILNNFHAMQRIGQLRTEPLTIELICEIHRIVTDGTLDDPTAAGRFQRPDEVRVSVWDEADHELHRPPPAEKLPERVQRLCEFANEADAGGYLPGVLRAITIHFMLGYEHPFEDGNGRTARALFYWSMLNQGYWLTEFLSVSKILKKAPSQYARSFLHTEQDENDLTYFYAYNLKVLRRAIDDLHEYLAKKMIEVKSLRDTLRLDQDFNARQIALLQHAINNPHARYTVQSHQLSHRISPQTARNDLGALVDGGLLAQTRLGKRYAFEPAGDLAERLHARRSTESWAQGH